MSTNRNTVVRSLHDLGLAAWFGGSLMGAVGLNGAAAQAGNARERLPLAAEGWARWAPVNAVAIGAHLVGSVGMLQSDRGRLLTQSGAGSSAALKTVLTAAALGVTAYSGKLGRDTQRAGGELSEGATEPTSITSSGTAQAQERLRATQWLIPALTGALLVLGALQGEQQRPGEQLLSRVRRKH